MLIATLQQIWNHSAATRRVSS